ncbi:MAG: 4-hydroxy-3-methylbut-2-enyl diphosphate reductase [Gammaproteobacteria bacterium]|nr:4-hydroxy-3-methylbut-2-enyl diphosphate reductase [Gammaproteobacteria bacterium]
MSEKPTLDIVLAQPRGFCAGVVRAIEIVERALEVYGPPVYVLHEIVHNQHVVQDLRARGAIFVERLEEVPAKAPTIFSAHGVATALVDEAAARELDVIDATCPLVTKVHYQAQRYSLQNYTVIIIGHPGHPEVEGTRGRIPGPVYVVSDTDDVANLQVADDANLAYVTQTTLSVDDTKDVIATLRARFPRIQGPDLSGICYATQNRQNAVRQLSGQVDILLVVGARNSSNSNRLREVGEQPGTRAYLVQDASEVDPAWFQGSVRVGITAGASTPEVLVRGVLERLASLGVASVAELPAEPETTTFRLPAALLKKTRTAV